MKSLVIALAAAALPLAGCAPPAPRSAEKTEPALGRETPDPAQEAVSAAVTAALAADLGQPVLFDATTLTIEGEWAWVVGQPRKPDGTPIDFTTTRYAAPAGEGMRDGATTYALLRKPGNAWRVVEFIVGPTNAAWSDWPSRYGAPAALLGLPTNDQFLAAGGGERAAASP